MAYTQIRIKEEYRDKLKEIANSNNRSMANMLEVLIDDEQSPPVNVTGTIFDEKLLKESLDKLTIRPNNSGGGHLQ